MCCPAGKTLLGQGADLLGQTTLCFLFTNQSERAFFWRADAAAVRRRSALLPIPVSLGQPSVHTVIIILYLISLKNPNKPGSTTFHQRDHEVKPPGRSSTGPPSRGSAPSGLSRLLSAVARRGQPRGTTRSPHRPAATRSGAAEGSSREACPDAPPPPGAAPLPQGRAGQGRGRAGGLRGKQRSPTCRRHRAPGEICPADTGRGRGSAAQHSTGGAVAPPDGSGRVMEGSGRCGGACAL